MRKLLRERQERANTEAKQNAATNKLTPPPKNLKEPLPHVLTSSLDAAAAEVSEDPSSVLNTMLRWAQPLNRMPEL